MMMRLIRRARNDEGVALAAVVGMGLVLTVLVSVILTLSTSGSIKSGTDRDASNATAAAYAGLADYQSRLTVNNSYEQYGVLTPFNTNSNFNGTNGNPAFGTTAGGTWASVVNSGGSESYRYEVDNSQFSTSGVLRLRVTGRSGQITRSLVANLKGTGFIDYLYFTDFESSNPAVTGEVQQGNSSKLCVSKHMTDPAYSTSVDCQPVQFITKDVLSGPVRTNDEFTICGATFAKSVQSTAANGVYNKPSSCSASTNAIFQSGVPQNAPSLQMPQTNGAMLQETRYDLTATTVPRPGCLYTGPTSITFTSNGNMTVVSPWTLATQIAVAANGKMTGLSTGTAATECGTIAALHSSTGATVPVPPNNLIYVQSVPSSNVNTDPNYWPSTGTGSVPTSPSTATFCSKTVKVGFTTTTTYGNGLTNAATGLTYPATNEYTGPGGAASIYGCRNGDAFVQGTFHGALTVGAQNNLYITGDITYTDANNDILGLVGQSTVTVWNPVSCSSSSGGVCSTNKGSSTLLARSGGANVTINAAVASNGGTFQVQNYGYGAQLGTLAVLGSIAQEFRGAVGVAYGDHTTGFSKSYGYDTRLQNTAPPKFLQPVTTTYGVTTEIEVKSAYSVTGAPLA
jgi:Tfp pilus assembly protein PilX